jgi:hypothetical protein
MCRIPTTEMDARFRGVLFQEAGYRDSFIYHSYMRQNSVDSLTAEEKRPKEICGRVWRRCGVQTEHDAILIAESNAIVGLCRGEKCAACFWWLP